MWRSGLVDPQLPVARALPIRPDLALKRPDPSALICGQSLVQQGEMQRRLRAIEAHSTTVALLKDGEGVFHIWIDEALDE